MINAPTSIIMCTLRWSTLLLLPMMLVHLSTGGPVSVMYERVEQLEGFNFMDSRKMLIRKYNRTVTILNGTLDLYHDIDDDYSVSMEVCCAYSVAGALIVLWRCDFTSLPSS